MKSIFYKYQGCGNDFILFDQRHTRVPLHAEIIKFLCNRRFGIGADGLMELLPSATSHFEMRYYNSDGGVSSFCGNGGRCIALFSKDLGIASDAGVEFIFGENRYQADFLENGHIGLNMIDVNEIIKYNEASILNTGSPHYVYFVPSVNSFDLIPYARNIRYSPDFPDGINVNIVEVIGENRIKIRTYERGVEDETMSCGTGVTASALAYHSLFSYQGHEILVDAVGGDFRVSFNNVDGMYSNVKLIGPAQFVFKGEIWLA